jgi:hypothetical protein
MFIIKEKGETKMIELVPEALSSLSAATKIISNLLSLRGLNKHTTQLGELQSHIIDANQKIIDMQKTHHSLTEKIQELEKEVVRLKDWSTEKNTYRRKQIAEGVFAYVENNYQGDFEAGHKLCCNCFEKTIKSTLQQGREVKANLGRIRTLVCPNGCPTLEFYGYIKNET